MIIQKGDTVEVFWTQPTGVESSIGIYLIEDTMPLIGRRLRYNGKGFVKNHTRLRQYRLAKLGVEGTDPAPVGWQIERDQLLDRIRVLEQARSLGLVGAGEPPERISMPGVTQQIDALWDAKSTATSIQPGDGAPLPTASTSPEGEGGDGAGITAALPRAEGDGWLAGWEAGRAAALRDPYWASLAWDIAALVDGWICESADEWVRTDEGSKTATGTFDAAMLMGRIQKALRKALPNPALTPPAPPADRGIAEAARVLLEADERLRRWRAAYFTGCAGSGPGSRYEAIGEGDRAAEDKAKASQTLRAALALPSEAAASVRLDGDTHTVSEEAERDG